MEGAFGIVVEDGRAPVSMGSEPSTQTPEVASAGGYCEDLRPVQAVLKSFFSE